MFARNLLQAGEYVTLVPVGIPMTLQYSETGAIEKIWRGFDFEEDLSDTFLVSLLQSKKIPNKISVQGGTLSI